MNARTVRFSMAIGVVAVTALLVAWFRAGASGDEEPQTSAVLGPEIERQLDEAASSAGFAPYLPGFLPTSANRLVDVDAGREQSKKIEFLYQSESKIVIKGREVYSTLEMFQLPVRQESPNGEKTGISAPGAEIYRHVVDSDEAGKPIKVTYTALYADRTYVMDFTGEQLTDEGLVKMLASMAVRK